MDEIRKLYFLVAAQLQPAKIETVKQPQLVCTAAHNPNRPLRIAPAPSPCANCAQPPSANGAQPHPTHLRSLSPSLAQPPRTGRK
ncbi:hypothetical protein ACOSQ3_010089 [Xanthoceras sorbifolium]